MPIRKITAVWYTYNHASGFLDSVREEVEVNDSLRPIREILQEVADENGYDDFDWFDPVVVEKAVAAFKGVI